MKYIKKEFLVYQLYTIISVFFLLIVSGLLKYLLRTFSLFLDDSLDFDFLFIISVHLYFFISPYILFKIFNKVTLKFSRLLLVLAINCILFFLFVYFTNDASFFIFIVSISLYVIIPMLLSYFTFVRKIIVLNKLIFLILFFAIVFFNKTVVHPILLQKQNFRTVSGVYSKEIQLSSIDFKDENGNILNLKDDTILFDFWNNTCGVCIKKFTKVEKLSASIGNQPLYLVNVVEDDGQMIIAKRILKKREVSLKNIFLYKKDLPKFDVQFYPTFIKVKNNEIVFKGSVETFKYFNIIENM